MARATLAPRAGMVAEVPPLRGRPLASMKDMGMDMSTMDHGAMPAVGATAANKVDHAAMGHGTPATSETAGAATTGSMRMRDPANAPQVKLEPGVQTISPMPVDRTGEPGQGLDDVGHKVLVYRDLMALERNPICAPQAAPWKSI